MIRYKTISEVAQPASGDELNFKEKHIIDHILDPNSEEDQFTADAIKKFKNRADYENGDDRDVYESLTLAKRALPGQESDDVDGDDDDDVTDAQLRYRRHAQIKSKIIDEAKMTDDQMKKREAIVLAMKGSKADLKKKYGKDWESVMYAIATKRAMAESNDSEWERDSAKVKKSKDPKYVSAMIDKWGERGGAWLNHPSFTKEVTTEECRYKAAIRRSIDKKLQQEGLLDVVQPVGGEFGDEEKSHIAYKKKNKKTPDHRGEQLSVEEDVSQVDPKAGTRIYAGKTKQSKISEGFSEGLIEMVDGTELYVIKEEADLLNGLIENLDSGNRTKMKTIAMSCEEGYDNILAFAQEIMNG